MNSLGYSLKLLYLKFNSQLVHAHQSMASATYVKPWLNEHICLTTKTLCTIFPFSSISCTPSKVIILWSLIQLNWIMQKYIIILSTSVLDLRGVEQNTFSQLAFLPSWFHTMDQKYFVILNFLAYFGTLLGFPVFYLLKIHSSKR